MERDDRHFNHETKPGRCFHGFTLVEMLIAMGVLSLFMLGAFSIYRSSSRGFVSGTWRAEEQKRAQLLISALRRDLSRATPCLLRIEADGSHNNVRSTPVYINQDMFRFNDVPVYMDANTNDWECLLVFSIAYPYIDQNATFSTPIEYGKWSGASLWVKQRKLRYIRNSDPTEFSDEPKELPASIVQIPDPFLVNSGADFRPDADQDKVMRFDVSLDGVACIASGTNLASPNTMSLYFEFVRIKNGRETDSKISQSLTVKLASQTTLVPFN